MPIVKKIIITLYCFFIVSVVQSQNHQRSASSLRQQERLPALKDWFLSTGNWQNSPQLYIREFGSGQDTIIMLHGGWGGDHSGLMDAVRDLEKEYYFIFYDQRGSLRSPFPDSLITFNQHIEDLELLRKELKLTKLRIVAHSMGAILAGAYATKYPQRVKQLILLAPAYLKNPIPEEDKELQHQAYLQHQKYMERGEVKRELSKYNLDRTNPDLSSREETSKFRISFACRMLYDITKWPQIMGGRALYKGHVYELTSKTYPKEGWDYVEEFKKGSYPVSIIIGDHDFLDFENHLIQKWVKVVAGVKLSIIKNAGHLTWVDQPKVFAKELSQYLAGSK